MAQILEHQQEGGEALHNRFSKDAYWHNRGDGVLQNRFGQRCMLVTEDFIVGFQLALEEAVGDAAGEIMYRSGFNWGAEDIVGFASNYEEEYGYRVSESNFGAVLESWWWPLQSSGWGAWRFDLSKKGEGLIFVDLYDSAVAKTLGNVGRVVCHYYAGLFAAVFGYFASRELSGIEVQCYGMGEDYCRFLIGAAKRINAAQFWIQEGATASEVIQRI
ncbi:MAG: V4R domain-containing protein [Myxococcota bacterium]